MGTAIMKLNIAQELASVDHDPLLQVFLYLRKAYNTVDRKRLIQILEGYGAGPRLCGLLEDFWAHLVGHAWLSHAWPTHACI